MSPSLRVRRALESDLAALVELINAAFSVEKFFINGERTDLAEVSRYFADGVFLVAEDRGRLVGCIFTRLADARGYFGLLSIDPSVQRGGIGRALVAAAEAHARAHGAVAMWIRIVNLREELPPYYRALGYRESGSEPFSDPHKLSRPCHFVLMEKPLT